MAEISKWFRRIIEKSKIKLGASDISASGEPARTPCILDRFVARSRRMAFSLRILLPFTALILMLVVSLGIVLNMFMRREMLEYSKTSLMTNLQEVVKTLDYFYGTYLSKSDVMFADRDLIELVSNLTEELTIAQQSRINEILGKMALELRYPEVQSTYYFGGMPVYLLYMPNLKTDAIYNNIYSYDVILNEPWYKDLQEQIRMFSWHNGHVVNGINYISFNRRLIERKSLEENAILQTLIPIEKIRNVIEQNLYTDVDAYIYLDTEGNRITGFGNAQTQDFILKTPISGDNIQEMNIDGKDRIICSVQSDLNGWKLVYVLPKEAVYRQTRFILPTALFFGIAAILMTSFFFGTMISILISRPVKKLTEKARSIASGDLSIRADVYGADEIAQLAHYFNTMVEEIINLTREKYLDRIQINEIKAELLQEQLNPHLLYNSLAIARMVAKRNNQTEIYSLLDDLINYYKSVLNRGRIICDIRTEIAMIRYYLSIVCNVYKLQIDTHITIYPNVEELFLVKLFLQPIIENAVMHGLRQSGGGRLDITGCRDGESLIFTVYDDGAGIEPEVLETIERSIQNETPADNIGYGIVNVLKRLRLFFPSCTFSIDSIPGEGTTVQIVLPALTENDIQHLIDKKHLRI